MLFDNFPVTIVTGLFLRLMRLSEVDIQRQKLTYKTVTIDYNQIDRAVAEGHTDGFIKMFVGQNGRIWLNGEPKEVLMAKRVIQAISDEAHLPGLTERITAMLEVMRPGGLDAR